MHGRVACACHIVNQPAKSECITASSFAKSLLMRVGCTGMYKPKKQGLAVTAEISSIPKAKESKTEKSIVIEILAVIFFSYVL